MHAINAAAEDDVASHAAAAAAAAALDFSCSSAAATACENWHKWSGHGDTQRDRTGRTCSNVTII